MSEEKISRVQFDTCHLEFIDSLFSKKKSDNKPFKSRAEILGFAAAYGLKNNADRKPLKNRNTNANSGADPIRYTDIFVDSLNLNDFISLLAFIDSRNPQVLSNSPEVINQRIEIFEEYANAGLHLLRTRLTDETSHTSSIIKILETNFEEAEELDDLSSLLDD